MSGLRAGFSVCIAALVVSCTQPAELARLPGSELAVLVDGLGVYSRPISTNSTTAQQFFDQGLNLTFGYYFVHAAASFQEAIRYDPDSPMLYWGLALAVGPNPNSRYAQSVDDPKGEGKRAILAAMRLRDRATAVERDLIDALYLRYNDEAYPDTGARDQAYIQAARRIRERYPMDSEAGFVFADAIMTASRWNYWDADGNPRPGTTAAASALERVIDGYPSHPGANHLYIHLFESSRTPERALPHADRLAATMPNAGHVVHMPSHIYIRVGQYAKAAETNRRSLEADRVLLEAWGDHPFPMICSSNISARVHGGHANDFIRLASTFQGNYADAIEYARRLAKLTPGQAIPIRKQRAVATVWLVHKIFGQWDELDQESPPPERYPYLQGLWRYVQGSKHAHRGNLAAAEAALTELRELQTDPDLQDLRISANPGAKILEIAADGLAGEIALASGDLDTAIDSFGKAVDRENALGYMEPPDWAQPMRLYLGHAYLKASKPELAQAVFDEALKRFPENGWALYGLWNSLAAQDKNEEGSAVQRRFKEAWRFADTPLTASVF